MYSLKIFLKLCGMNLKKMLVFRASFWISLGLMAMWVTAYTVLIEVIFLHTKTLAGWDKGSVLLIMAFYYFIQNLSDIFYKDNFEHFGDIMRRGELDHRLTKPASARLLSFFWEIRFDHTAGLIVTGFLFWYALKNLPEAPSALRMLEGFGFSLIALVLYYSILSFIATLAFFIQKNDTFNVLIFNVSQLSRYPRQIYGGLIGKFLTFGLPLALVASVPAEQALQFENGLLPYFFIGATGVLYLLSQWFWNVGLRRYTSAS